MGLLRTVLLAACWAQLALAAHADPRGPVALRFGDHDGFGRMVFDVENGSTVSVAQTGSVAKIGIPGTALHAVGKLPHNVVGIEYGPDEVRVTLQPGVIARRSVVNQHLVLDAPDPQHPDEKAPAKAAAGPTPAKQVTRAQPNAPAQKPLPQKPLPQRPVTATSTPPPMVGVASSPVEIAPKPMPTASVAPAVPVAAQAASAEALPIGIAAKLGTVAESGPGHLLEIPFGPLVGAAAFREGNEGWVVFDERRPIDLASVRQDPVFGVASVQELPEATLLRVALPPGTELRLERQRSGWLITAIGGDALPPPLQPIIPETTDQTVSLPARQPGQVVSVPDPATGGVLLVGTQREAGQAVPLTRLAADFALRSSWQGVVVAPVSDVVSLLAVQNGFEITASQPGSHLSLSPQDAQTRAAAAGSQLSRILDLPHADVPSLYRRLQSAIRSAADAAPQSKAQSRRTVAEAMLALGLGAEAQSVLDFASGGDARLADDTTARLLSAVAALLADRPDDAASLEDPTLNGNDEVEFWRAIRLALQQNGTAKAAQELAATLPLLDSYPETLRERLLPLVAETLAQGGQDSVAQAMCDRRKDDTSLDLARAILAERRGETDNAIQRYERLANTPNRLRRYRGTRMAVELALASGKSTASDAAKRLEKLLFAWRGDGNEVDLRLRVAQLEGQAGEWRAALQLLRETEAQWPERSNQLHARLVATFTAALQSVSQGALKPFDAVALAAENADLMPQGEAGLTLARRLSDQLVALDLPDRAIGVLEKMVQSTPPGLARAGFGEQLAAARLQAGDSVGALKALTDTSTDSLPPDLLERRGLVFADAVAAQGDFPSARQALLQLDSEPADRKLAALAESTGNWPEAVAAWRSLASRIVPPSGMVDEPGVQILLRLAGAAAQAKDDVALAGLRAQMLQRLPKGHDADLFDFLTSGHVASSDQLPPVRRAIVLGGASGAPPAGG